MATDLLVEWFTETAASRLNSNQNVKTRKKKKVIYIAAVSFHFFRFLGAMLFSFIYRRKKK